MRGGREESSDRQHYLQQLSQLLVFPFFLHGTAQLFSCDDCSEHGDGEHDMLPRYLIQVLGNITRLMLTLTVKMILNA